MLRIFIEKNEIVGAEAAEARLGDDPHGALHLPCRFEQPEKAEEVLTSFLPFCTRPVTGQKQHAVAAALAGEVGEVIFIALAGTCASRNALPMYVRRGRTRLAR